jgi:multiple sugar transport system substrate-binding protein
MGASLTSNPVSTPDAWIVEEAPASLRCADGLTDGGDHVRERECSDRSRKFGDAACVSVSEEVDMSERGSSWSPRGIARRAFLGKATKVGIGLASFPLLSSCGFGNGNQASRPPGTAEGGGSGSSPRSGTSPVTISMMGWGSPLEKENVDKGLQRFQSNHPDITVKWIHVPDDYATKLKTALAGGTPSDLFWATNMRDYVARGVVMDVTSRVQQDPTLGKPDYFIQPQEKDRSTVNGKWFGIGSTWVLPHLYYNADLLEKAGVAPPSTDPDQAWTWEEFIEIGRRLTLDASGKHPGQDGFDPNNVQQWGVSWPTYYIQRDALVYSNGGEPFTKEYECKLGEPEAVEAIQAIADLTLKHHIAPQAAVLQQLGMDASQMLASGKLAILAEGSWALQDIAKMGFRYGAGVLPKMKQAVTTALAHLHMVHKDTPYPDAAWALLAYLSSDDYQRGLIKAGLWLPSHTTLLSREGVASWLNPEVHPKGYDQIATTYLLKNSRAYIYPAGFEEADRIITSALDPVWIGQMTAEEALKTSGAIEQVNQVLKEARTKLEAQT